jgi:hypothetical protein
MRKAAERARRLRIASDRTRRPRPPERPRRRTDLGKPDIQTGIKAGCDAGMIECWREEIVGAYRQRPGTKIAHPKKTLMVLVRYRGKQRMAA